MVLFQMGLEELSNLAKEDTDGAEGLHEVELQQEPAPLPPPPSQPLKLSSRYNLRRNTESHHPLSAGCDDNWTWNDKSKSHEVRLYGPKNRIAHFHPNWSNGTAGVRGTRMLNNGRFYWELNVSQRIFGTRFVYVLFT